MKRLLIPLLLLSGTLSAEEPKSYMGREIAHTMHESSWKWLVREEREREEHAEEMIRELKLKPGMTVVDMGSGAGYHTIMMAPKLLPDGKVICVEIQQGMLDQLKARADQADISNYESILGKTDDPLLPKNAVDLILMVDVYHEFREPEAMLTKMKRSLKKNGRIVLVEFRKEDPNVPIKPNHKMSKAQIEKELTANGFTLSYSYDKLPWQHMMFYELKHTPTSHRRR